MKTFLLAILITTFSFVVVQSATIHVDANADADGDGSLELPYKSFADALDSAHNDDTILVKGGEGQVYDDYPYDVWQTNLTVTACGSGRPLFSITGGKVERHTGAFSVSGPGFSLRGVELYGNRPACSEEESALVWVLAGAHNPLFEDNHFEWDTADSIPMGSAVSQAISANVTNMVARNNFIKNSNYQYSNRSIFNFGNYALVVGNVFTNTQTAVAFGNYSVAVSNTIINSNCKNGSLSRAGWGVGKSATFAFNIIYQNNGITNPAILKNREGFTAVSADSPTRIFNNTVIGASSLVRCENSDYASSSWAPVIVNNIAWCTQTNIVDVSEVINDKNNNGQTIFNSGTIIQNNLFKSDAGVVFEDRVTLLCSDNVFNNSDYLVTLLETEDFLSEKYFVPQEADKEHVNAGYGTSANGYVRYIGAKPVHIHPGILLMVF